MQESLASTWLRLQCQLLPRVAQGAVLMETSAAHRFALAARWPESEQPDSDLISGAQEALRRNEAVLQRELGIVSCPVAIGSKRVGAVSFGFEDAQEPELRLAVALIRSGAAFLGWMISSEAGTASASEILGRAISREHTQEVALVTVTDLARELRCERVSLGLRTGESIRLEAVSDRASIDRTSPLVRLLQAAMVEALESKPLLVYREASEEAPDGVRAHELLAEGVGSTDVCSVPLLACGRAVGVLTLERACGQPFNKTDFALIQEVSGVLGPALELKRRVDAPWKQRIMSALREAARAWTGPSRKHGRMAVAAALVAIGVLCFARGTYRVPATATVEGSIHQAVVAPYDGYLESARASAGDSVQAGQVLATLQEGDLRLEHRRLASERDEFSKQYNRALAAMDHIEAQVLASRRAQADLEVKMLEERLGRSQMTAPFDGVIVKGDLTRSLGAPVERGQLLFEVTPADGHRVVLRVDERDIADVAIGQPGTLVLASLPGQRLPFTVERVTPVSQSNPGRNVFRVEARLEDGVQELRPGMAGVAKIDIETRNLVWIYTHRMVDWVRLQLWVRRL